MCSIEAPPLCAGLSHNAVALEGTARCVKRTGSQSSARLLEVIEVSRGLSQSWLRMEELVFRIVSQVNIGHGYSPGGEPWRIAFVRSWSAKPIGTTLSACTERHRPPRDSAAAPGPCC